MLEFSTTIPETINGQSIFNKVLAHLRKQGVASQNTDGGTCLYRGPNGRSCAIGCLIPDDEYKEIFEYQEATAILPLLSYDYTNYVHLLTALQCAHDFHMPSPGKSCRSMYTWEAEMRNISLKFNLVYNSPVSLT